VLEFHSPAFAVVLPEKIAFSSAVRLQKKTSSFRLPMLMIEKRFDSTLFV
jgi:hypothetical protein